LVAIGTTCYVRRVASGAKAGAEEVAADLLSLPLGAGAPPQEVAPRALPLPYFAFVLRSPAAVTTTSGMQPLSALLLAGSAALAATGLAGGTAAAPTMRVQPQFVRAGNEITATGAHFRPRLRVTFSIRSATGGRFSRLGRAQATGAGAFRFTKTISRSTIAGKYVVRACQRSCATKATATFRVAKIKPV
jgi:hypothetical protein